MLLNVSNPLLFSPSKDNGLPREIEFACTSTQLLPTTIQQLYSKYISLFNMTTNTTLSCPSLQSHTRTPAPIPKSSDSLPQDFLQTPLAYLDESIPRCPIDVIRIQQSHNDETKYDDGIQTISMNDYYSNYIQKKIPVVIRGIIDKSDHHWSFPSLMKVGERLKVAFAHTLSSKFIFR